MSDPALQVNAVEPQPIRCRLQFEVEGKLEERDMRLRPISVRDDRWIIDVLEDRDLSVGLMDDDLTDCCRVFCHQLYPDDLEYLCKVIGYTESADPATADHVAIADLLMSKLEADPHAEPGPGDVIIAKVMACRSRSFPKNLITDAEKKKRHRILWCLRWMRWSSLFAIGYLAASMGWIEYLIGLLPK